MNNNYYSTYRFFNEKKRRLSAFARELNGQIEIVLWECDKNDDFTKATARNMYETYLSTGSFCYQTKVRVKDKQARKTYFTQQENCAKPKVVLIDKTSEYVKNDFLVYMEENFLKPYPIWKMVGYKFLDKQERDLLEEQFEESNLDCEDCDEVNAMWDENDLELATASQQEMMQQIRDLASKFKLSEK